MQHRFLPIFSNFVTIACIGIALCGCAKQQEPPAAPETSPAPAVLTAAPTAAPVPSAIPAPENPLADVTAETPAELHPYFHRPEPRVREDALPPATQAPASDERETGTRHTDGSYDYIRYADGTAGLVGCHFAEPTHVFDLPETVDGITVTGLEPPLAGSFAPATMHTPRNDIIIRIPSTVRYIGYNIAEAEPIHDITIEIAADSPYFQAVGNTIFSADGTLLHSHQSDPMDMHPQVYVVPDTVTDIGARAFYHMQELIDVRLPEGLRSIGANAFDGCENLSEIVLPASLETVGEDAFSGFAMTLVVQGNETDLGPAPDLDAIALICCGKYAAANDYAKAHDIPTSRTAPPPVQIAVDPATLHLLSYIVQSDGTAKILRIHSDSRKDFTLPETIGGYPVTAIGYETLLYINEKHEDYPLRIRIPDCIKQIDAGALWPETIIGKAGSAAERFAAEEGIEFIAE